MEIKDSFLNNLEKFKTKLTVNEDKSDDLLRDVAVEFIERTENLFTVSTGEQKIDEELLCIGLEKTEEWLDWTNSPGFLENKDFSVIAEETEDLFGYLNNELAIENIPEIKTDEKGQIIEISNNPLSNGHMPALLLAPYRILGPAFLGFGVLVIIILGMFAG